MTTLELSEQTKAMLDESLIEGTDAEQKIRSLLRAEYLRKLAQHRRVNLALEQKYRLGFKDFITHRIAEKHGFAWNVETDAMSWELAVSGIETLERKLSELASHGDLHQ